MPGRIHLLTAFISWSCGAMASTWNVGPGQTYTAPSQVSTLVGDGDTVNIAAGTYPGDVARWTANDLVLRGVGGYAYMESNGNAWGEKAIWVIQGDDNVVEWIAFSECTVPDHNGAGIRLEGLNLTVQHCWFHHNEMGILCGEYHPCTVRVTYSEFGHQGYGDGYSHNVYIGNIDTLIFRFNYSHHAVVGHELKSRAWVNIIEYNRLSNEEDGTASRAIDLPDGGQAYLIGNVIQQGPFSENSNIVGFGMESLDNPGPQEIYAVNNTLVNEKANGTFFQMPSSVYFKAWNNVLAGGGSFMSDWPATFDTLANARSTDIAALDFFDAANYNYHISASSPAHAVGIPAGMANSGLPLVALYEYVHPADGIPRCQQATLDAGAYAACATGMEEKAMSNPLAPNPVIDRLYIRLSKAAATRKLEIMDAYGRVLIQGTMRPNQVSLDVRNLDAGQYFLMIRSDGTQSYYPFIKL